jgi:hypothetical protein
MLEGVNLISNLSGAEILASRELSTPSVVAQGVVLDRDRPSDPSGYSLTWKPFNFSVAIDWRDAKIILA